MPFIPKLMNNLDSGGRGLSGLPVQQSLQLQKQVFPQVTCTPSGQTGDKYTPGRITKGVCYLLLLSYGSRFLPNNSRTGLDWAWIITYRKVHFPFRMWQNKQQIYSMLFKVKREKTDDIHISKKPTSTAFYRTLLNRRELKECTHAVLLKGDNAGSLCIFRKLLCSHNSDFQEFGFWF